jgi:hypothetical protein
MKRIISASRRTDLVAFFPAWLVAALQNGKVRVLGPSGRSFTADLRPEVVHTIVLWSKDFSSLIRDVHGLRRALEKYDQLYFLFTVTGLGGTFIEREVPPPEAALGQLREIVNIAGNPRRVSLRFDPIVFWQEDGEQKSNLGFFERAAESAADAGVRDIRFSFTQWYGKALRRARRHHFNYEDPEESRKIEAARWLVEIAGRWDLRLHACSQAFLAKVPGIRPSSCIDGALLRELHPSLAEASVAKDRSQRPECGCTESVDIGSYAQACPHACLYCYANPRIS